MKREIREIPILFQDEMVRALLNTRPGPVPDREDQKKPFKIFTRRIIKPLPIGTDFKVGRITNTWNTNHKHRFGLIYRPLSGDPQSTTENYLRFIPCPYGQPGDFLWVREAWRVIGCNEHGEIRVQYRADGSTRWIEPPEEIDCLDYEEWFEKIWIETSDEYAAAGFKLDDEGQLIIPNEEYPTRWRPSIFMPKFISRIWLKNSGVGQERIQQISEYEAEAEGIVKSEYTNRCCLSFSELWDQLAAKPKPVYAKKEITHYTSFPWSDIRETREHRGKPWYVHGNPRVWKIKLERLENGAS